MCIKAVASAPYSDNLRWTWSITYWEMAGDQDWCCKTGALVPSSAQVAEPLAPIVALGVLLHVDKALPSEGIGQVDNHPPALAILKLVIPVHDDGDFSLDADAFDLAKMRFCD
jgi:hypothetical protein